MREISKRLDAIWTDLTRATLLLRELTEELRQKEIWIVNRKKGEPRIVMPSELEDWFDARNDKEVG